MKINITQLPKEKLLFFACSIITILGALFVRLNGLGDYYLYSDEAWHMVVASQKTLAGLIDYNFREEIHPPLSTLIWHIMLKISDNILWLRSAAYIPAILLIPSAYILGNLLIGRAAGFAMAVIAAFGMIDINPGVVIRAYPMMLLALAWAGIFLHKYIANRQRKYLLWYFILAFASIQLVHSAAFLIVPYGLLLMWNAYKNKDKNGFLIILFGHLFLVSCLLGYIGILKFFYGYEGSYDYFLIVNNLSAYLWDVFRIIIMFLREMLPVEINKISFYIFSLFLISALSFLIIKERLDLLCIIIAPLACAVIANYFLIYPFSGIVRNHLYLFIPFLLLFGFVAQKLYEFILKFVKSEYHFRVTACAVIAIPLMWSVLDFRNSYLKSPGSLEFYTPKQEFNQYLKYVNALKKNDTVMILEHEMIWHFLYLERDSAKVEYLTENLGHFKSDNYEFYFCAFPGRDANTLRSFYTFEKFSSDLLDELSKNGRLPSIKNIIYTHIGGNYSFFGSMLRMGIKLNQNPSMKLTFNGNPNEKNEFDLIQKIITSNQVVPKIYKKSPSSEIYITILGMTPEFVRENISGKEFINKSEVRKKMVLGK